MREQGCIYPSYADMGKFQDRIREYVHFLLNEERLSNLFGVTYAYVMMIAMNERRRQILTSSAADALQNLKADKDDRDRFYFSAYDTVVTSAAFFCSSRCNVAPSARCRP